MSWNLHYHPNDRIIELTYSGKVSPQELNDALDATRELADREQTAKVLANCLDMTGGHSVLDLYSLISRYDWQVIRELQEALVMPHRSFIAKIVRFYETAAVNRALKVRVFDNREAAWDWLLE